LAASLGLLEPPRPNHPPYALSAQTHVSKSTAKIVAMTVVGFISDVLPGSTHGIWEVTSREKLERRGAKFPKTPAACRERFEVLKHIE
jgi:hypothetical protein